MENGWTIEDACELYNVGRWGLGFFDVDDRGHLVAKTENATDISIVDSIEAACLEHGLQPPFIVRFPHLLRSRMVQINRAFDDAIAQFGYRSSYRCFFPAKVNQHRDVIAAAIRFGREFSGGMEAGSKAELCSLLLMADDDMPLLCNGFKDRRMIELALRGMQLGRNVTIVIEKLSELAMVVEVSTELGLRPRLGVRIKLAARSGGRWNASGGTKSKFGMSVSQLLEAIGQLRDHEMLDCLYLLHFHPGSQISNVRKIKLSIVEAARVYVDLIQMGVPLTTLDVGGGLAVDYTGERSQDPSSKNYSLHEYANDVVYYIQQVCREAKVVEPHIVSESGRAIAAHHSLLVIEVLETQSSVPSITPTDLEVCGSMTLLVELKDILESVSPGNLSESYHDAQAAIESVWQMFSLGAINLRQRAYAEQLAGSIFQKITRQLNQLAFVPSELADLRHQLANTYIANFSLFQAVPDAWALDQVFPVVPLHRLQEKPNRRAVVGDITCDSDGQINRFIGSDGGSNSLPVHEINGQPYYLGIFLIGAYQEALSDDHNLMGDFHAICVDEDGSIKVRRGESVLGVLENVDYREQELRDSLRNSVAHALVCDAEKAEITAIFESVMDSYTYLQPATPSVMDSAVRTRRDAAADDHFSPNTPKHGYDVR